MIKNKTHNSNLGEVLYGSVIGVGKIVEDFLTGALQLPVSFLLVPTALRMCKNEFEEAKKQGKDSPISGESFKNYWTKTPIEGIGAVTGGILIGQYGNKVYHFISEHPSILAIPVITNILSAGYERYRSDKLKGLEAKFE